MFETIRRLYDKTKTVEVLDKAVAKGWISKDEKAEILAG